MKCLNSLGHFQVEFRNLGSTTEVTLQPTVLSFSLSLGFQKELKLASQSWFYLCVIR